MTGDDAADFREHPEWFEPNRARTYQGSYKAIPIFRVEGALFVRKPIPFVLPIRGSAL